MTLLLSEKEQIRENEKERELIKCKFFYNKLNLFVPILFRILVKKQK